MKNKNFVNRPPETLTAARPESAPQTFITISADGEICAWGLDQQAESLILGLTGNRELIKANRTMAYELCG